MYSLSKFYSVCLKLHSSICKTFQLALYTMGKTAKIEILKFAVICSFA